MRCLVRLARLMSTPASAYVIGVGLGVGGLATGFFRMFRNPSVGSVPAPKRQPKAAHCSTFNTELSETGGQVSDSRTRNETAEIHCPAFRGRALPFANAAGLMRDEVREEV